MLKKKKKKLGTFGIFLAHESRHSRQAQDVPGVRLTLQDSLSSSDLHGWAALELGLNLMLSKMDDANLNDIRQTKQLFAVSKWITSKFLSLRFVSAIANLPS